MGDPWVQTFSGVAFDLLAPRAEDVKIGDIAISLARINRFAGHTLPVAYDQGYSVAQHSVLVSRILSQWGAPLAIVREGLLHDAGEAYYGDTSSPVKRALATVFSETLAAFVSECPALASKHIADPLFILQRRVDLVVRRALKLPEVESPIVKRADLVALACERAALMGPCARDWQLPEFADRRWIAIHPFDSPCDARREFLDRLNEIDAEIEREGRESLVAAIEDGSAK